MVENPRPQYTQIADVILSRIKDGTYPVGRPLPSEDHLADEFAVSRVTVNRAIRQLRSSGDVRVKHGSGTIVRTRPRILRDAQARYAVRHQGTGAGEVETRSLNLKSRTDYRRIGRTEAPPEVAAALSLTEGELTLLRSRVLYANDEPTQIADSYYPWSVTEGCTPLMQPDAGPGGSYGRLADLGYGPIRFTEDVSVRMPSETEQRTLGLEPTQPVFQIWHVAYTVADRPIEVCVHVMPGAVWTLRYAWDDRLSAKADD